MPYDPSLKPIQVSRTSEWVNNLSGDEMTKESDPVIRRFARTSSGSVAASTIAVNSGSGPRVQAQQNTPAVPSAPVTLEGMAPRSSTTDGGVTKHKLQEVPAGDASVQKKQRVEKFDKPRVKRSKFGETLGTDSVIIMVSRQRIPTLVHKAQICAVSDFFDKAFNGVFKETSENEMVLEDTTIPVFDSFLEWLYHGPMELSSKLDEARAHLVDVYLFADQIMSRELKNFVMDKLQDSMYVTDGEPGEWNPAENTDDSLLPFEVVNNVFKNTTSTKDSPIRKFCAALVSYWLVNRRTSKIPPSTVVNYFTIPGFLGDLQQYQSQSRSDICEGLYSDCGEDDGPTLENDPRIRGRWTTRTGYRDGFLTVGLPLCFFHAHGREDECTSQSNHDK